MSSIMAIGSTNALSVKEMTFRNEVKDQSFGMMMGDAGKDVAILPWKPSRPEESALSVHEEKMDKGILKEKLGEKQENSDKVPDSEKTEKANELTGKMKDEIKEKLEVSDEELEEKMAEMGLTEMDLLNPEDVFALCLELGGAEEMDLLTNGDLYQAIGDVLDELTGLLQETAATLGMPTEELVSEFGMLKDAPVVTEESVEISDGNETETQIVQTDANGEQIVFTQSKTQDTEDETSSDKQSGNEHETAQHLNLTEQSNTLEAPATNEVTTTYSTSDTQNIMNQMLEAVKLEVSPQVTELKLQLHPESLGNVHVQLTAKEGMLTASFTAQNEVVKNVLETQMIQLKETLEQKGIQVEAVEVKVDAGAYNEQYQDAKDNESKEAFEKELRKSQPRRINLMDYVDGEELGELEEAEELAVKMMKENGNSLDYSA